MMSLKEPLRWLKFSVIWNYRVSAVITARDLMVRPWCPRGGKVLVWDATCADSFAPSHTTLATREARAVAANAEQRKHSKYPHLDGTHHFVPTATKTLGAISDEGRAFFKELRRRIRATTQEPQSYQYFRNIEILKNLS